MGDYKNNYSESSTQLRNNHSSNDSINRMYERSRKKHDLHIAEWNEHPVNLNEVVEKYAPESQGKQSGIKMIYPGPNHNVVADMASGSLRIYDTSSKKYVSYDGGLSSLDSLTHFRILKREEM